jgi:hypothetical protein
MQEQMAALQAERDAAAAAERERQEAEAAAEKARKEEGMEAKDLIAQVRAEMEQKIASERDERERAWALLEKEREFTQLSEWRSQRLAAEDVRNEIAPSMLRFVSGTTPEEIEASIANAKAATSETLAEIQAAQQQQWNAMPGVSPRAPAMGPIEQQPGQRSYSPDEIKAMSMAEWQRVRPQMLEAASRARYAQQQG